MTTPEANAKITQQTLTLTVRSDVFSDNFLC